MTVTGLTVSDLEGEFTSLLGCCLHTPVWTPGDVDAVLCSVERGEGPWASWDRSEIYGYVDSESYTVARLKDGTLGLLAESSDTSGHGCQCDAYTSTYASVKDLLELGIVWDEARTLIRQLLAVPGAVVSDSGELEAGR